MNFQPDCNPRNEYFLVKYPKERDVFVDGASMGLTNQTIEIGPGTYTITLGEPKDYAPESPLVQIFDTFPDEPKIVVFEEA